MGKPSPGSSENLTGESADFDTFSGFPTVDERDSKPLAPFVSSQFAADSHDEAAHPLIMSTTPTAARGHIGKVELDQG